MKKFTSIFMALVMILSLNTVAFAANETFTLTLTGAAGHVYDIYQIYTGDIAQEGDDTVLSNVKYGINHYPVDGATGDAVPTQELEDLMNAPDPVEYLNTATRGTPYKNDVTPAKGETQLVVSGIPAGYYMIVDVSTDLPDGQTKSPIILQVLETVTISSKHAEIRSEKKVDDKNDSTTDEDDVEWQDSADYDIGDDVPFQLSVTLPSTLEGYDDYELTFHDKQQAGFNAPENFNVYILKADGKTKITIPAATAGGNGYSVQACATSATTCEFGSNCSFTVHVGDVIELYGTQAFTDGDKIIVEYTAELNNVANIGKEGNENGMYVCHPDGHTPEDYVTVLTYELKVNKTDGATGDPLAGAGFTLYKFDAAANDWIEVGDEKTGGTSFTWIGIDGGKYKLVETTTPAGYNTMADMEFTVDATHKDVWTKGGNHAFMDLIAKDADGKIVIKDANAAGNEDGKLERDIENHQGVVLPETGARGTFLLIGFSSMLVAVAVVFMITRKKMSVYED